MSFPNQPMRLPPGIRESYVPSNDLTYHVLSAGDLTNPLVLCLHGFPEVAFSWRKIMPAIAQQGYHVVAYDQRGFGRTKGWDTGDFASVDLNTFSLTGIVRDAVILVNALGYREVSCVIGHDFGAVGASLSALMRPDMFKSVITMSHPFGGLPPLPFNTVSSPLPSSAPARKNVNKELAELPTPRKLYKWYYSTPSAASEMDLPKEELHDFLRGYFYLKSADWEGNDPQPLKGWEAGELAKMPYYYVMPLKSTMRESVKLSMADVDPVVVATRSARWLDDSDLDTYVQEYGNRGFQGGLNWYRVSTNPKSLKDVELFAGKKIDVPALFIAGAKDWGMYQEPGVVERLGQVCSQFRGIEVVDGAGHWVQQEQPQKVIELVSNFLRDVKLGSVSH